MSMPNQRDQTTPHLALITGCTGGIGRATAIALASQGISIAVHYHSNNAAAAELVAQLKDIYRQHQNSTNKASDAAAFQADLSDYAQVRRLHAEVVAKMGDPDVLFNNAGVSNVPAKRDGDGTALGIEDVSIETFENTWRTNTGSAYLLTQQCLPAMLRQHYGRIVFNSSIAAFTGGVIGPHYASSKSAMHGLVHWLSSRYCSEGITVNGVAPALITDTSMLPGEPQELRLKIPVGRLGRPHEVAEVVAMMNAYLTNKVIPIDGGWYAQ